MAGGRHLLCITIISSWCEQLVLSALLNREQNPSFDEFMAMHQRSYKVGTSAFEKRKALYLKRAHDVVLHNSKPQKRWTAGINFLSDWSEEELAALYGWNGHGMNWEANQQTWDTEASTSSVRLRQVVLPQSKFWGNLTSLQHIRDQGSCGSCWAVTAATVLDAHSEIYSGSTARSFSAQQLVSCVPNPQKCGGTGGCEGATVELAFEYALKNGLASGTEVPYLAASSACGRSVKEGSLLSLRGGGKFSSMPAGMTGMRSWKRLPENKYEPLMQAVVEHGPVGVSAGASGWSAYLDGIFDDCQTDTVINHAVTLIGYGQDGSTKTKYWSVQNSWGSSWGEGGRIRLLRTDADEQNCGIDDKPQEGTACEGGPQQVKVCGMCGILYDSAVPIFSA